VFVCGNPLTSVIGDVFIGRRTKADDFNTGQIGLWHQPTGTMPLVVASQRPYSGLTQIFADASTSRPATTAPLPAINPATSSATSS
jgi:hypothetical protein